LGFFVGSSTGVLLKGLVALGAILFFFIIFSFPF
jgi:hypothetical protein